MTSPQDQDLVIDISQAVDVEASPEAVYRGVLDQLSNLRGDMEGEVLTLRLEEWPGGRWFRDLGDGAGHLWGFVQSIKPPTLIELYGPMFMSFAVASNLIIRVEAVPTGARVNLRHQILGQIPQGYRDGIEDGWARFVEDVKGRVQG